MTKWPRWLKVLELLVLLGLVALQVPAMLDGHFVSWMIAVLAVAGVVYLVARWPPGQRRNRAGATPGAGTFDRRPDNGRPQPS